jgi:predicted ABC-type sugar transport system permease subunit
MIPSKPQLSKTGPVSSVVSGTTRRSSAGWVKQYGGILTGLLVLVALFWRLSPVFMVAGNLLNIVLQVSITAILAFGMTYVLLLGEIDLSVSENGIRDYLVLLSICETCKYMGLDFLDFVRSGEKDIHTFRDSRPATKPRKI